jgi:hypothetical protein
MTEQVTERTGAEILVREGEEAFAWCREQIEEHGPILCWVRLPGNDKVRCPEIAVMKVYGKPFCEAHGAVEDPAGLNPAIEHVGQELLDVSADRRGSAAHGNVVVERRQRRGHRLVLGNTNAADGATRTRDGDGRECRLFEPRGSEAGEASSALMLSG